jgi:hypothetical protein
VEKMQNRFRLWLSVVFLLKNFGGPNQISLASMRHITHHFDALHHKPFLRAA